jgi:DNA-binding transcriptional LysR family regulator
MIDLTSLGALRAVATSGSVTAAAEALGYTPSAVSQQIKRLERQAGVPLLERVGRGVMLTGHGHYLAEQGARLLGDLEELESELHQQANTVAGHVRLVAFATAVRGLVAPALSSVLRTHPGLRVTITEREPWDAIGHVATGQADLGVVHRWGDVPLPVPDHLAQTTVARDLAEVIVRRDHVLAGRPVVTPRDLADEDWVATPEGSTCRQWLYRMFDGTGRLPAIAHVSMEFDSHLTLVRAGLAIALIPRMGRAPLGRDLVAVPVADPVPIREIIALHRASMSDSPAIEALLAALAKGDRVDVHGRDAHAGGVADVGEGDGFDGL